jgi:NAD/NADP transhydrogenase alpha subunit
MWGRVIGTAVSLGIIAYMFHAMNASDSAVKNAVDNNPAMKEQKQMLRDAGVNPDDPEAVKKYAAKKAKEIEEYQHSADNLQKEP